ncbi:hypothetical protein B0J12DRAFT_652730, partial [Macrophomina phaseolina]
MPSPLSSYSTTRPERAILACPALYFLLPSPVPTPARASSPSLLTPAERSMATRATTTVLPTAAAVVEHKLHLQSRQRHPQNCPDAPSRTSLDVRCRAAPLHSRRSLPPSQRPSPSSTCRRGPLHRQVSWLQYEILSPHISCGNCWSAPAIPWSMAWSSGKGSAPS